MMKMLFILVGPKGAGKTDIQLRFSETKYIAIAHQMVTEKHNGCIEPI
ncbi:MULTISPECIES: hypothetical protein [Nostoc]|uniref:Uncharacterized protein n=2 Tax=Nostoc TaxID=1177 RepID=A0ABR8IB98_9NOSO|nr:MULTISPECIES: hypothetical protein [Nostoc]MBD2562327.1 hypothetical protein [Nostoc linckia FACHB-391]MBD2647973.1 hypothetical protein [Nostoc foliaceum FACHB-393]